MVTIHLLLIYKKYFFCISRELNQVDHGFVDDDEDYYEADKENLAPPPIDTLETQKLLWVEKYSPRGYTDLLSDEVC